MDMHMALLLTTLAGLSTGLGGLVVWLMRTPGPRIMALSQGFAAGVMMTVSLSEMLPSAVEAYAASGAAPVGAALRCASLCAAGMLAALLLEKSLPEDETLAQRLSVPGKTRAAALRGALATTAAIVLHNLPEGILTLFTNAADSALGPSLALAIALHNIPEGIAVAVPVYYATHSRAKSLLFALGSGLAEPAGALAAFFLLRGFFSPLFLNGLLALVAGVMLQVSFAQLLADGFSYGKNGACAVGLAVGTLCMGVGLYLV